MSGVRYNDLGLRGYGECWKIQQEVFDKLVKRKTGSGNSDAEATLILCEHPHVYTLGKSGEGSNLLVNEDRLGELGAELYRIDRGGDITYHGPGQLVGYPILDLEEMGMGLREYIHLLEECIIKVLAVTGIEAGRVDGAAGVWLQPAGDRSLRKICAIGVKSSRFVTMHGFALNVSTDLDYFRHINPCGFTDRGVTSVKMERGTDIAVSDVKTIYRKTFEEVFRVNLI